MFRLRNIFSPMVGFFAGEIYAWGMGTSQQLGSGEDEDITTPQLMTGKQLQTRYSGQIMGLLVML